MNDNGRENIQRHNSPCVKFSLSTVKAYNTFTGLRINGDKHARTSKPQTYTRANDEISRITKEKNRRRDKNICTETHAQPMDLTPTTLKLTTCPKCTFTNILFHCACKFDTQKTAQMQTSLMYVSNRVERTHVALQPLPREHNRMPHFNMANRNRHTLTLPNHHQ